MIKNHLSPLHKIIFLLTAVCFIFPGVAFATTIKATLLDQQPGKATPFRIRLEISATTKINALSGSVSVPQGFSISSVTDGNSIINLWVEKPSIGPSKRDVSFSGIVPGGFSGSGTLVELEILSDIAGVVSLPQSLDGFAVYLHQGDGVEDPVTLERVEVTVVEGDSVKVAQQEDKDLPERFLISLAKDELFADGKWTIIFATQDKSSGIRSYDVAEKKGDRVSDYTKLKWYPAKNPYILRDQKLRSNIYVRATDNNGNVRIESMPPQYPITWYDYLISYGPVFVSLIFLLGIIFKTRKSKSKSKIK